MPSDEELLELPSSDEEDHDAEDYDSSSVQIQEEDREAEENWGTSRKDYYNADTIETEVDALEEEEEALRMQQKQLQGMAEADFGFDEADWLIAGKNLDDNRNEEDLIQEVLPQLEISDDLPREERTRILTSRYPEFEALSTEYVALEKQYAGLSHKMEVATANQSDANASSIVSGSVAKWRCLGAYLGVLSMYFVLFTSGYLDQNGKHTTIDPIKLRRHPIMESLVRVRKQWYDVKDLSLPDPDEVAVNAANGTTEKTPYVFPNGHSVLHTQKKRERQRKTKAQIRAAKAKEAAAAESAVKLQQTRENLAQIAAAPILGKQSLTTNSKSTKSADDISDFGELPNTDTHQQDRRKKSLAFYTSQIASKSQKRNLASKGAGGDNDIPHRERFRDRIARLNAQAQTRGQDGKDRLGDGSDDEDARVSAEVRNQVDSQDYYQTIASSTQRKKEQKAARTAALAEAKMQGAQIREVEQVGADGKRAITYAIEKNKGLTPKRKKEARNPRVKKRLKYEEKMKKLGSVRQLYKGGEGRGGYAGELTGIKSSIVRSRKL